MINYKKIMGYSNKKKVVKEQQPKSKKNQILEGIKKDLNEWNDTTFRCKPKRWSGASDKGLTEYEQELKEVGASAEYRPHIKRINKLYDEYWDSVKDFQILLGKKGLNKVSGDIGLGYMKLVTKFHKLFGKIVKKLL